MKTKSVSLVTDIQGNHKEQIMEQKITSQTFKYYKYQIASLFASDKLIT